MTTMLQASGELHLEVTYKPFEDDDTDTGYREAEAYALLLLQQQAITDVKVRALPFSYASVRATPYSPSGHALKLCTCQGCAL